MQNSFLKQGGGTTFSILTLDATFLSSLMITTFLALPLDVTLYFNVRCNFA